LRAAPRSGLRSAAAYGIIACQLAWSVSYPFTLEGGDGHQVDLTWISSIHHIPRTTAGLAIERFGRSDGFNYTIMNFGIELMAIIITSSTVGL